MNLRHPMTVAVLVALTLGVGGLVNLYGQGGSPGAASIAVCDVEKVFNELDERSAVEADIQSRISELQQWEQQQRKEIQAMQGDLSIMSEDSPNYRKRQEELRKKLIQLRVEMELRQRQVEQEKALQLEMLYRKIIDGVEQLAEQSGYDLVLFHGQTPELKGANQQQIAAMIQMHKVLYASSHLEITDRVKQKLNNDYNNRATGGGNGGDGG